jgi:hypothetical protein
VHEYGAMIAILLINHRTLIATTRCLAALMPALPEQARVLVLDNGSGAAETAQLRQYAARYPGQMEILDSAINLGFAGGMNLLLGAALADRSIDQILMLNSDTEPQPGFIPAMQACVDPASRTEMVAAQLRSLATGGVDSLGITLYRSTLASNRKQEKQILLGPSGGCALFTRRLLEDLFAAHGEWFDESFFCYAEDTDLVLRARWLGYRPAYARDAIVYHAGSLSSGGPGSDFVLYHGIRNSLWWLIKDAPTGWLLRSTPWFLALHAGICLRHLRRGRGRVLWRLYRDAIKGMPAMRKKRAVISQLRRVPASDFAKCVEPSFYEPDYLRRAWRELWETRRN